MVQISRYEYSTVFLITEEYHEMEFRKVLCGRRDYLLNWQNHDGNISETLI